MREQRKALSLFLVFALLLNLFLPVSIVSAANGADAGNVDCTSVTDDAYADEQEPCEEEKLEEEQPVEEDSKFRLTDYELSFEDKDGNKVEEVDLATIISVKYKWELPNGHGYTDGATFTFNLPPELKVYEVVKDIPLKFNTETIGTFSVDNNGTVTIVFNDFIEKHSNINGTIEVLSQVSEETIVTEDKIIKVTPIEGKDPQEIPIKFHPIGSTIDKRGVPNKGYNAKEIVWTVDFNKNMESIKNAVLSDPIQAGQELKPGSIQVYELIVRLDGSITQGEELESSRYTIEKTKDNEDFQISFGDIGSAYRVIFTTNITDEDGTEYKNKATLSGDGFTSLDAEATVSVRRGIPLAKRAAHYDPVTQTITWEIKYNYNEKSIAQLDAVLTDLFNNTQEIVIGEPPATLKDAFTVKEMKIDEDGKEEGNGTDFTNFTVTEILDDGENKGFTLQFDQDITSAFKITYKTKASDRVFDNDKITNTVTAGNEDKGTVTQPITQQILIKGHGTPNYKDKTIPWTITFNKDSYPMKNVVLTDTFPNKGLLLKSEPPLKITNTKTGEVLVEGDDYTLLDKGEDGFVIEFLNDIEDPHKIEYTTDFDYEQRTDKNKHLINHAHLTWIDEKGNDQEKRATATFEPDGYTKSNGFKGGSYNAVTKEITWRVGINYNLQKLTNAYVEDTIEAGQTLLPGTLKVYKLGLTGNPNGTEDGDELTRGSDYTVEFTPDQQRPTSFRVNLTGDDDGKIDSPYLIEFKTSLADQLIVANYKNTAKFDYDNAEKPIDLTADVSVTHGGEYVKKTGAQNGKLVDWKVEINFGQSTVSNAKITDTPSNNQTLLEDSFHLFATTVSENGSVQKGAALVRNSDYKLEIKEENEVESFEIKFLNNHNPITHPYILEYQSLILAGVGKSVKNEIKFSGDKITTEIVESTETITVKRTTGMGTGTGETGKLEVIKVDAADTTKVLEGATFTLYDSDTDNKIKTLTTGPDGTVTFTKLLYGDYYLKEDQAPAGYVVGIQNKEPVTINKSKNELQVTNEKIKQAVKLTKVDQDDTNITLEGAEFELQREEGTDFVKVSSHKTNDQGEIIVNNLDAGKYRFVETKAPEHYLFDSDNPIVKEFTIVQDQTTIVEIKAENERGKGKLILIKVDAADDQTKLEGAVFKLYNSANQEVATKTTGSDGQIEFDDLPYDRYTLREITAPTNYIIDITEEEREILISKPLTEQTIKNYKLERSFKLIKVDASNKNTTLAGAVFELRYKAPGSTDYIVIGTEKLTTDENGEIIVQNLPVGDYQLIEVTAPTGYILDATPIEFSIEREQIKVLELTKENKRRSSGGGGGGGNPPSDGDGDKDDPPKDVTEEPKDPNSEEDSEQPGGEPEQTKDDVEQEVNSPTGYVAGDTDEELDSVYIETHRLSESDADASKNKKLLPQTGEALPWTPFLGMLLIALALVLWFRRNKVQTH